jgi:hypothetical protein
MEITNHLTDAVSDVIATMNQSANTPSIVDLEWVGSRR